MKKMNIKCNNGKNISIEYNPDKYDIYYENYEEWIILKDKESDEVTFIFDNDVNFIVECDIDKKSHFIVSDYGKDENGYYQSRIKHFVDNGGPILELVRSFKTETTSLEGCRIDDACFLIENDYNGGKLYNLNKISKKYSYVNKNNFGLPKDHVVVSEKIHSTLDRNETDEISYMIDINNYEIKSSTIKSKNQNREIYIYDKDEIYNIDESDIDYLEASKGSSIESIDPFDITVYCEIVKRLDDQVKEKEKNKQLKKIKSLI